jgi:hypothetical protein
MKRPFRTDWPEDILNVRYVTFRKSTLRKNMRGHRRAADEGGTELTGAATRVHGVIADTWAGDSKRAARAGFESFVAVN